MANRELQPAGSYGSGRVYCEFQFTTAGASAPALSSVDGADAVSAFAHTGGTNVITVTLKDTFNKFVAHSVDIRDDAGTGGYCTIGTITNEGASGLPTFKIQYFTAAGAANNNPASLVTCVTLALRNGNQGQK